MIAMLSTTRSIVFLLCIFVLCKNAVSASIEVIKINEELDLISIQGPIEYRDDVSFRLKALNSKKAIVALVSPGGNLDAGLSIGKQIRASGYATMVGAKLCASACALAWLGGERRYMTSNASIGFHAAYVGDGKYVRESGLANALVGSYLAKLGLSDEAIVFITSAPPEYLNWLDVSSAQRLGIDVLYFEDGKITPNWAQPKSDERNVRRAAINFHKRINKVGMGGMVASINACYQQVENKKDLKTVEYCLSLDWSAMSFDRAMSNLLKFPPQEFFLEERVVKRFAVASKSIVWGEIDIKDFFRDTTALAERLVFDQAVVDSAKQ